MTTLIKNVQVVDGSGQAPVKTDVLVKGGSIAALGAFPSYRADRIIYGNELFLSPGFIDINAGSDRTLALFSEPTFEDFFSQGITTALLGHCGFSLAPSLYGTLHAHGSWAFAPHMNANWKTFGEFVREISKRYTFGINIGSLVGHRVVREDIVYDPSEFRKLTGEEIRLFRHIVSSSIEHGAFGLSSNLGLFPYDKTPYHELRALADSVAKHKALYTTHLRNETDSLYDSVREAVKLSLDVSVRTIISHLRPFDGYESQFEKSLSYLEGRMGRAHVHFDINPFPYSAVSVRTFLPPKLRDEKKEVVLAYLADPKAHKETYEHMPSVDAKEIRIFLSPGMSFLQGSSLYDFAQNRHLDSRKALIELMRLTKCEGIVFYKNLNEEYIRKGIASSQSLISTNSSHGRAVEKGSSAWTASSYKPLRMTETFPQYIRQADSLGMSIEKTVAKITSMPASLMGLHTKGRIAEGFDADVVLFAKDGSVSMVMVNGSVLVEDGKRTSVPAVSGKVLKHAPSSK